VQIRPQFF